MQQNHGEEHYVLIFPITCVQEIIVWEVLCEGVFFFLT
jgi:hypothetical protein